MDKGRHPHVVRTWVVERTRGASHTPHQENIRKQNQRTLTARSPKAHPPSEPAPEPGPRTEAPPKSE